MRIDPQAIEAAAKELYIRALKILPDDIKRGFERLWPRAKPGATAQTILGTMVRNIAVAEQTDNLLCQDTGMPIYNVIIGRGVEFDARRRRAQGGDSPRLRARDARASAALFGRASADPQKRAYLVRHRGAGDQHRFRGRRRRRCASR